MGMVSACFLGMEFWRETLKASWPLLVISLSCLSLGWRTLCFLGTLLEAGPMMCAQTVVGERAGLLWASELDAEWFSELVSEAVLGTFLTGWMSGFQRNSAARAMRTAEVLNAELEIERPRHSSPHSSSSRSGSLYLHPTFFDKQKQNSHPHLAPGTLDKPQPRYKSLFFSCQICHPIRDNSQLSQLGVCH